MRVVLYFARAYPRQIAVTVLCMLLVGVADVVGLTTMLPVIGVAAGASEDGSRAETLVRKAMASLGLEATLGPMLAVVGAALCLKAVLLLLSRRQVGYTVARVATDLRLDLLRALFGARWSFYTRQSVGKAASSLAMEAARSSGAYVHLAHMLSHGVITLFLTALAVVLSWQLTLIAAAGGVLIWFLPSALVRKAGRAGSRQTKVMKSLIGRFTETLRIVKLLKATAREGLAGPMLHDDARRLNRAQRKEVIAKESLKALHEPLIGLLVLSSLYFALAVLGMTFQSAFVIMLALTRALVGVTKIQRKYQLAVTESSALWSIRGLIVSAETAVETSSGTRAPTLTRGIDLRGVSVNYDGQQVLERLSLEIPAGQITALVGGSGSGKTTLVDLITGLLQPQAGEVRIDGVPLDEIDLSSWRRMIGYVPQEHLLIHDSVRVNVTLGDPAVGTEEVVRALKDAGAWDFVSSLPEGIDASVGERGSRFSGGQQQRIALARALLHRPRLLILDEATSGLDPASEDAVWAAVQRLRGSTATVAISHQAALTSVADRIYEIGDRTAKRIPKAASSLKVFAKGDDLTHNGG